MKRTRKVVKEIRRGERKAVKRVWKENKEEKRTGDGTTRLKGIGRMTDQDDLNS